MLPVSRIPVIPGISLVLPGGGGVDVVPPAVVKRSPGPAGVVADLELPFPAEVEEEFPALTPGRGGEAECGQEDGKDDPGAHVHRSLPGGGGGGGGGGGVEERRLEPSRDRGEE